MLLCGGIEKAFDRLELCFLPDVNGDLCVHVLDNQLAKYDFISYVGNRETRYLATKPRPNLLEPTKPLFNGELTTFENLDGRQLNFKTPPFRRILWLHALCAMGHKEKNMWTPCRPLTFSVESDRAFRRLSEENPFAEDQKDNESQATESQATESQATEENKGHWVDSLPSIIDTSTSSIQLPTITDAPAKSTSLATAASTLTTANATDTAATTKGRENRRSSTKDPTKHK